MLTGAGIPIDEFSNICVEALPPAESLTMDELTILTDMLENLLNHCNYYLHKPEGLPYNVHYGILRENWDKFILPVYPYSTHFEVCNFKIATCPFPEYCNICSSVSSTKETKTKNVNGGIKTPEDGENELRNEIRAYLNKEHPGFIPGIYNYCDRYCDDCAKTANCLLYGLDREVFHGSFSTSGQDFREHVKNLASKSTQILCQEMQKAGIMEDPEFKEKDIISNRISAEGQQILLLAGEYNQKVSEWIDEIRHNSLSIDNEHREAFKTILKYYQFIQPKLNRALIDSASAEPLPVQSDQNGSAQIALVAINRSIHAWSEMIHVNCRFENEGICCILLLNGMRKAVEGIFRDVDKFIKPGTVKEVRIE